MKALKIIILLSVGFILGLFFMPVKYSLETWWKNSDVVARFSFTPDMDIEIKEILIPLVEQGDIDAYKQLYIYFSTGQNGNSTEEILPYALLMANKYNYDRAYFDVFNCLWALYSERTSSLCLLDSLDETTRNLALEHLQKGAELGEINCLWRLGTYYFEGKYFEQDTILGQKLKDKS